MNDHPSPAGVPDRLSAALSDRYRMERELGQGGMATVYLADDRRHGRKVAIKVLKPELAAVVGADRFLTEIRTTATLQHPHILPLFDSGEADGFVFYVMPYVDGESLRERLDREKQLPVEEAVGMAVKVAGALQAAHDRGVIHRDIKPANILLQNGEPLVSDFGIALAVQEAGGGRLTETGLSLGTPYYMSPEQASADRDPDPRSDQYSLACVLYEMLTGDPPHMGSTAQAVMARILTSDPAPVTDSRRAVPDHVSGALDRALERLPADRFASVSDFASALEGGGATTSTVRRGATGRSPAGGRRGGRLWPSVAALALLAAGAGWLRSTGSAESEAVPSHLAIPMSTLGGAATALDRQLALSPDGSTLLINAVTPDGGNRTLRRVLHEREPMVLAGTREWLAGYSISRDGTEFLGYDRTGRLYRYNMDGTNERAIATEFVPFWTAWDTDGGVWVSTDQGGYALVRLDESGAVSKRLDPERSGLTVQQVLPDDETLLTVQQPVGTSAGPVIAVNTRTGEETRLLQTDVVSILYTSGYLVWANMATELWAVPFDVDRQEVTGEPVRLAEDVAVESGIAQLTVSDNGSVAYMPSAPRSLVLVSRDGSERPATEELRNYHGPAFSPDGRRLAVDFSTDDGRNVWIMELDQGIPTRATFDRNGHDPVWSLDGSRLFYLAEPSGPEGLGVFSIRPGDIESEPFIVGKNVTWTGSWVPDGSAVVTTSAAWAGSPGEDIVILRNGGRGDVEPLVATRFGESFPSVSPDGRWLAYVSLQSGREEVYIRPLEGEGEVVQASLTGGTEPVWNPRGGELFYRSGNYGESRMVAVRIGTDPRLEVLERTPLFSTSAMATSTPHPNYAVSPDGETFAMVRYNPSSRIMLIQNLPQLVQRIRGTIR